MLHNLCQDGEKTRKEISGLVLTIVKVLVSVNQPISLKLQNNRSLCYKESIGDGVLIANTVRIGCPH